MRFLCKKCGAQSPGDLSGIEVRDGALVFVCTACGTSATLVAGRSGPGPGSGCGAGPAGPVEKGVVEPDEEELVDLGEATLSRMLGRKVRIVAEPEAEPDPPSTVPEPGPTPATALTLESAEAAREAAAVDVREASPAAFEEPDATPPSAETVPPRRRLVGLLAAGVVLAAVVTFALLEARQTGMKESVPATASTPGSAPAAVAGAFGSSAPGDPAGPQSPAGPQAGPAGDSSPSRPGPVRTEATDPVAEPRIAVKEFAPTAPVQPVPADAGGGGLTPEDVDAAFWRVRPGVRMCATQEQRRDPDARLGEEAVSVTFGPSGVVTAVMFDHRDLEGTALGACLATEMRKVRLEHGPGRDLTVRRVLPLSRSSSN